MSIKIPKEVKNEAINEAVQVVEEYAASEPKTKGGKLLRKLSKIVKVALPFLKNIQVNKKP